MTELTRATSLSVLGVSSPGNLIIGEGRACVAWKPMKWSKNTLRTIRRQLNIVGEPIFPPAQACLSSGMQLLLSCAPSQLLLPLQGFFFLSLPPLRDVPRFSLRTFSVLLALALFLFFPLFFPAQSLSRLRQRSREPCATLVIAEFLQNQPMSAEKHFWTGKRGKWHMIQPKSTRSETINTKCTQLFK